MSESYENHTHRTLLIQKIKEKPISLLKQRDETIKESCAEDRS